jgi:hypothetical protein
VKPAAPNLVPRIGLDEGARELLDFERTWGRRSGRKERAIRERFGYSSTRYHQLLNGVIDLPGALAYDPMLVRGLRRLRETRRDTRLATRLGCPR